ncbi:MAG: serpin family protein [Verrucomicrobia bacterium]|nr:serpin family protein [Verrucomicrobiota bacterium]
MREHFRQPFYQLFGAFLCLASTGPGFTAEPHSDLAGNTSRFGFQLLARLVRNEPRKQNFVISPVSIDLALKMTYAGAEGTTATAIADTTGWSGIARERILEAGAALRNALKDAGTDVELRIANAIWVDAQVELKDQFSREIKNIFSGEIFSRRFQDPDIVRDINTWVSRQTAGKISELASKPPPPPLLLVDAVYFKAPWRSRFEPRASAGQAFYLEDKTRVDAVMMHQTASFPYLKSDAFEAVRLPYIGDRFGLVLLLPAVGLSTRDLVAQLSERSWSELQSRFQLTRCDVAVPKFKITYETALDQPLKDLGMDQAFDRRTADFRRMLAGTTFPLYIGSVLHKTYLRVDEAGSEAAAATAVGMRASALPLPTGIKVVFDRPFVLAITDQRTQTILFTGILGNPENAGL